MTNILLSRRQVALGLLYASVVGVAAARQPTSPLDFLGERELEDIIPRQIGNWTFASNSGLVIPPEDQLVRATYSQLLTRSYVEKGSRPIMLLVAQSSSQTGILQIHRPEFCYTAGGYKITRTEPHLVNLPQGDLPALSLAASADGFTEQIVYWTRIGDRLPSSWREQRLAVAFDNLQRIIPDAVMVRVSTYSGDRTSALRLIDQFVTAMMASMSPADRRVLIGEQAT